VRDYESRMLGQKLRYDICCSWESTISHSEGDRFVDPMLCFSFFGAHLVMTLFGGGRIEVVSGKTNCRNCSFIWTFIL